MPDKIVSVLIKAVDDLVALTRTERQLDAIGRRGERLGRELTVGITLPVAAIGGAAVKARLASEDAFTEMAKTVDAPIAQLEALQDRFETLSEDSIPRSANELTRLAALGGQLGILTDNLEGFVRTSAALDVATDLGAEEAATGLAQLNNIMGTAQTEFGRTGSTLVDLGNNLATTESRILRMGLRIAGAGRQFGLNQPQVLGYAGALSSLGLEADAGGSAFSKLLATLATGVAKGGSDLTKLANIAGVTGAQYKQVFERDGSEAVLMFIEGLGRLREQGVNTFQVLESVGLGERRVTDALLRAANASDLVREAVGRSSGAWETNTALTGEAQKFYDRTAASLKRLRNGVVNSAAALGEEMEPSFRAALSAGRLLLDTVVRPLIRMFAALPQPIQTSVIALIALASAAGPAVFVLSRMIRVVAGLRVAVAALSAPAALTGLAGLVATGGPLVLGLAATAAGIVAVGKAVSSALGPVKEIKNEMIGIDSDIGTLSPASVNSFGRALEVRRRDLEHFLRTREALLNQVQRRDLSEILDPVSGQLVSENALRSQVDDAENALTELVSKEEEFAARLSELNPQMPELGGLPRFQQGAAEADKIAERIKGVLSTLRSDLAGAARQEELLGDLFDIDEARAQAYAAALDTLSPIVTDLDRDLDGMGTSLRMLAEEFQKSDAAIRATEALKERREEQERLREELDRSVSAIQREAEANVIRLDAFKAAREAGLSGQEAITVGASRAEAALELQNLAAQGAPPILLAMAAGWLSVGDAAAVAEAKLKAADQLKLAQIQAELQQIQASASRMAESVSNAFLSMVDGSASVGDAVKEMVAEVLREMARLVLLRSVTTPLTNFLTTAIGSAFGTGLPGRASGGPVTAGKSFLVGEKGPEIFTPSFSGMVLSNDDSADVIGRIGGGGGSTTVVKETHVMAPITLAPNMIDGRGGREFVHEQAGAVLEVMQRARAAGAL